MFCTNCGNKLLAGQKYCSNCGAKVTIDYGGQNSAQKDEPMQNNALRNREVPNNVLQNRAVQNGVIQQNDVMQKETFYVKRLPLVMIVVLTIGLIVTSMTMGPGSMLLAMLVCFIQGFLLMMLIYRQDRVEPEPIGLLVKLFLFGAIPVPIAAMMMEVWLEEVLNVVIPQGTIISSVANAFIVAAFTEEICKYAVLKLLTWRHPAFNFRFDGIVYSTTVAIGFEVVENLLYLIDSDVSTAFLRAAFPGHCIFAIYMGYYYGQAKSLELNGDIRGSARMRRKGIMIAILIHGFYDAIAMLAEGSDDNFVIFGSFFALVATMCVLNVKAYKNIKKFAHEDKAV